MRDLRLNYFILRKPGQKVTQQVRFTPRQVDRMRLLGCAAAGIAKLRDCLARKTLLLLDDELLQLNDVVAAATARGQLDYVLRRAAMLHADVAMSTRSMVFDSDQAQGAVRRVTIRVEDGRDTAIYFGAIHWDIARSLLDVVRPAGDPMVRLWSHATASWMQATGYHESVDHVLSALRLFPTDATLLFLGGAEHESLARPAIQAAARSVDLPPGFAQQVDLVSFDQVPLNVVLVFDMSNSVEGDRRDRLINPRSSPSAMWWIAVRS